MGVSTVAVITISVTAIIGMVVVYLGNKAIDAYKHNKREERQTHLCPSGSERRKKRKLEKSKKKDVRPSHGNGNESFDSAFHDSYDSSDTDEDESATNRIAKTNSSLIRRRPKSNKEKCHSQDKISCACQKQQKCVYHCQHCKHQAPPQACYYTSSPPAPQHHCCASSLQYHNCNCRIPSVCGGCPGVTKDTDNQQRQNCNCHKHNVSVGNTSNTPISIVKNRNSSNRRSGVSPRRYPKHSYSCIGAASCSCDNNDSGLRVINESTTTTGDASSDSA